MKMLFEKEDRVTIVNCQKGNKKVSRQSIADYCTGDAIEEICRMTEESYAAIDNKAIVLRVVEMTTILAYVPFVERIMLMPQEPVLKIKIMGKSEDVKIEVSRSFYNFLNKLN